MDIEQDETPDAEWQRHEQQQPRRFEQRSSVVLVLIVGAALQPIRWVIEAVLVAAHAGFSALGPSAGAGMTWVLADVVLLVVVRLLVLPLAVAGAKNTQQLVLLADRVNAVRDDYQGRLSSDSRRRRREELRALRKASGANQFKSLIPQLIQIPILLGLSSVLSTAQRDQSGVGPLTHPLARSFSSAAVLGVPFRDTVLTAHGSVAALVLGFALALVLGAAQFTAQATALRFNTTQQARRSPIWRFRPTPLFLAPPVLIATSITVPIGLLVYLATSSLWTLGQQLLLLWHHPLPTTPAFAAQQARAERKTAALHA